MKDYVTRDLFEKLMQDEEEHIDFLETQLGLVAKLGVELYSQHHIGKLDDSSELITTTMIDRMKRGAIRAPRFAYLRLAGLCARHPRTRCLIARLPIA